MTSHTLEVGALMPRREMGPITRTDIVRFAGAGGDFNPLHHDDDSAQAAGFEAVIAMGQFQTGLLAAALSDWVGAENVLQFSVRFARPVKLGDVVLLEGTVNSIRDGEAELALSATVNTVTVVQGSATVRADAHLRDSDVTTKENA